MFLHTAKRFTVTVVVAVAALLWAACTNPLAELLARQQPAIGPSGLIIHFSDSAAQTLVPSLDMNPASYVVSGSGPNGSSFTQEPAVSPVTVSDLAFGDWTVVVEALNGQGTIIGKGVGTTTLHTGQTQDLAVQVTPLDGYGAISLTLAWDPAAVDIPAVEAELVPPVGSSLTLAFTQPTAGSAVCLQGSIPTGYYTLVLQLLDNGIPVMGTVEVVRIVKDQTTSGQLQFDAINTPGSAVAVNITPDLKDPIAVTLSGQMDELLMGESMTVSASVPSSAGNVVYAWYVNGVSKAVGSAYSVGADLPAGSYRLDVTAFSADGARAGSTGHRFQVNKPVQVTLSWDTNGEPDVAGYRLYYGLASRQYGESVEVGSLTTATLKGLHPRKTYYISATAYNTHGQESGFSNEVVFTGS